MANTVVWMDGFETMVATTRFAYFVENTSYYSTVTGHEGGVALKLGSASGNWAFVKSMPTAPTLNTTWLIASFMYRLSSAALGGAQTLLQAGFSAALNPNTAGCRMGFYVASDGTIGVRKDATTYGTTSPGIIATDTWYHIEYRHRYGNATFGNFEVRVNGTSVVTGVGDNSGVVNPIFFGLQGNGSIISNGGHQFDDVILATSNDSSPAWFGISKVRHLPPTSTSTNQWLGSDGDSVNNHLLVDDNDPASTDWVTSTAGTAQRDLYGHGSAATGSTVHAVQPRIAAGLDVIGTDDFSIVVKSAAAESLLRKSLGSGTPVWLEGPLLNNDPNTGAAWTKSGFDASLFGVKS